MGTSGNVFGAVGQTDEDTQEVSSSHRVWWRVAETCVQLGFIQEHLLNITNNPAIQNALDGLPDSARTTTQVRSFLATRGARAEETSQVPNPFLGLNPDTLNATRDQYLNLIDGGLAVGPRCVPFSEPLH